MVRNSQRRQNLIIGGITLATVVILGWLFGPSGAVQGVEFSPDRFAHRSFRYYQWCGIPISLKSTREWHTAIDSYVHEHGFAPPSPPSNPRWDFIKGTAPGLRGWSGEAKHMCQAVGCWNKDDRWLRWSTDHPELAAIVWPQVVAWAQNQQYAEIAVLFQYMELESAGSPDEVQQKLREAEIMADI